MFWHLNCPGVNKFVFRVLYCTHSLYWQEHIKHCGDFYDLGLCVIGKRPGGGCIYLPCGCVFVGVQAKGGWVRRSGGAMVCIGWTTELEDKPVDLCLGVYVLTGKSNTYRGCGPPWFRTEWHRMPRIRDTLIGMRKDSVGERPSLMTWAFCLCMSFER